MLLFFWLWYPSWGQWWLLQRHCGNLQERIHVALKALSSVDHFGQICSFSQACMDLDLSLGTELPSSDGWPFILLLVSVIISQHLKIDV